MRNLKFLSHFPSGAVLPKYSRVPYTDGQFFPRWFFSDAFYARDVLYVQPGPILFDKDSLFAVGGWNSLSSAQDLELFLRFRDAYPGVYVDDYIFVYYFYPTQTIHQPWFAENYKITKEWVQRCMWARRADIARTEGKPVDDFVFSDHRISSGDYSDISKEWLEQNKLMNDHS